MSKFFLFLVGLVTIFDGHLHASDIDILKADLVFNARINLCERFVKIAFPIHLKHQAELFIDTYSGIRIEKFFADGIEMLPDRGGIVETHPTTFHFNGGLYIYQIFPDDFWFGVVKDGLVIPQRYIIPDHTKHLTIFYRGRIDYFTENLEKLIRLNVKLESRKVTLNKC